MQAQFPEADVLANLPGPHHWDAQKSSHLVAACRELARFHAEHNGVVRELYRRRGFDPEHLRTEEDLERLPLLGVTAMKHHLLLSLPPERCALRLTSSGTRGQKTQIWLDEASLNRAQAMLRRQWEQEDLVSSSRTHYVVFGYDPREANDLGVAFSDKNQQQFAPVESAFYALRKGTDGAWEFRRSELVNQLKALAEQPLPVRLFGLPEFVNDALEALTRPLRLPAESLLVTGGGWKAAEDKRVSKAELRAKATERLGLDPERIRDVFGMAEHCAPYLECRRHRFHVPAFARVLARDPETLAVLPPGQVGLLELISPFNAMMPNLALLSTDLGQRDPEPCPCGHSSPTFTLVGRGGLVKHKGCAITAGELVRRHEKGLA